MNAKDKAKELINMYYSYTQTQKEAIEICERVVLDTLCKKIDGLYITILKNKDIDGFIIPEVNVLKFWQEVAYELGQLKQKLLI